MTSEEIKKRVEAITKTLPKDTYPLSEWREEVCLSIRDLCNIVGISTAYFRKVRSNKTHIPKKIYEGIYNLTGGKVATRTDILS